MKRIKITYEDKLFSEYIRKRAIKNVGGCERCLTPKFDKVKDDGSIFPAYKQLQCSHFISRRQHSTRWDECNACGFCAACHMYFTGHPLEHVEFFKARLGDVEFERLKMRSQGVKGIDIKLVRIYLNQLLKETDNGK